MEVSVKTDQLAQERDGQQTLPFLTLLLENDLGEDRPRDVVAGFCVAHDEILTALHHRCKILQRDIGARARVIEPPVGVFFYYRWFFFIGHDAFRRLPVTVQLTAVSLSA